MKIKRLEIKGFKSIEHLVLDDVPSLMVLAGSNGAGKSNVVDALRFFSMAISQTVGEAAEAFGGFRNICCWRLPENKQNQMSFRIDVCDSQNVDFYYELDVLHENEQFQIIHEILVNETQQETILNRQPENLPVQYKEEKIYPKPNHQAAIAGLLVAGLLGGLLYHALSDDDDKNAGSAIASSAGGALLGGLAGAMIDDSRNNQATIIQTPVKFQQDLTLFKTLFTQSEFYQFISNIQVFRIEPRLAKQNHYGLMDNKNLAMDGSNIADFLQKYENNAEFRTELLEWLEMIVPSLEMVQSEKRGLDNSTYLKFKENSCEKAFPAGLISDGTIYTLCILTAILSRSPQHGITIIEEPERGIHPQAIGELIALMREKAQDKHNIILTTHSEAVVRNLELAELYLVRKKDGQTLIKDVKNSKVDKNKIPLDTAWLSNLFGGGLPW